jgi:hypothetical protein
MILISLTILYQLHRLHGIMETRLQLITQKLYERKEITAYFKEQYLPHKTGENHEKYLSG